MALTRSLAIAASAVVALAAHSVAAQELKLVMGTLNSETTSSGRAFKDTLLPKLQEYGGGKFTMDIHWGGRLCAEHICGEQMKQGLIDITTTSTANFGNFAATYAVMDLPFLFKDTPSANKLAQGWFGEALAKQALADTGFKVFGVYASGGFRVLGNSKKEAKVPADVKGLKFRVTKSPVEFTLVKAWGGIPTPYDFPQTYQALQTGILEGCYVQLPWQELVKLPEVQPYFTFTGGAWGANLMYMDDKRFKKMSADQQTILTKTLADTVKAIAKHDEDWVNETLAKVQPKAKAWYTPNESELAQWRAGAIEAWVGAKGTYDKALVKKALEEQGMNDFVKQMTEKGAL